ncbi:MAG: STAS domain-containing protein [Chitinivibrionales bacterium]
MKSTGDAIRTYRFGERLHFGNADRIRQELEPYISQETTRKLILDLEAVSECDSSGLKLLLDAKRKCDARSIEILLLSPRPVLKDLLRLTRLDTIFTIIENRSDVNK